MLDYFFNALTGVAGGVGFVGILWCLSRMHIRNEARWALKNFHGNRQICHGEIKSLLTHDPDVFGARLHRALLEAEQYIDEQGNARP